jgi:hypothetical protein
MFRVCAVHNLMPSSTCAPTDYGSSLEKQYQEAVHILLLYQHQTLKHGITHKVSQVFSGFVELLSFVQSHYIYMCTVLFNVYR